MLIFLILLSALLSLAPPVFAQPTVDASSGGSTAVAATSLTFTHTIGGSVTNGAVSLGVVWVPMTVAAPTVTVGGTAASLVSGSDSNQASTAGPPGFRTAVYCLATGASTGVKSVVLTWASAVNAGVGMMSWAGANQTTPCNNGTTASSFDSVLPIIESLAITSTATGRTFDVASDSLGLTNEPREPSQTAPPGFPQLGADSTTAIGISYGPGGSATHTWTYDGAQDRSGVNVVGIAGTGTWGNFGPFTTPVIAYQDPYIAVNGGDPNVAKDTVSNLYRLSYTCIDPVANVTLICELTSTTGNPGTWTRVNTGGAVPLDNAILPTPAAAAGCVTCPNIGSAKAITGAASTGIGVVRRRLGPVHVTSPLEPAFPWDLNTEVSQIVRYTAADCRLYYSGILGFGILSQQGVATSTDCLTFTRSTSNPILALGAPPYAFLNEHGYVFKESATLWWMTFTCDPDNVLDPAMNFTMCLAKSTTDGLASWVKQGRILTRIVGSNWAATGMGEGGWFFKHTDGFYYVLFTGSIDDPCNSGLNNYGAGIGIARSTSATGPYDVNSTPIARFSTGNTSACPITFGASDPILMRGGIITPTAILEGTTLRVWFQSFNATFTGSTIWYTTGNWPF